MLSLAVDITGQNQRCPGLVDQHTVCFVNDGEAEAAQQKLAEIEPKAMLFVQDQLRGGPLLFYSQNLDGLSQDGNRAAGVRHNVFGDEIGVGLHALNPGIAVGKLHTRPDPSHLESLDPKGIYLLPETVSDLPPIAGILTAGEGNPLSHVQLLARNLGIPNVSVNEQLTPRLDAHDGERAVLAVSPAGLVELARFDDRWAGILGGSGGASEVVIRPDLVHRIVPDRLLGFFVRGDDRPEIDAPAAIATAYLPKLILQPLVENAIKHGIERKTKDGLISLSAEVVEEGLRLEVQTDHIHIDLDAFFKIGGCKQMTDEGFLVHAIGARHDHQARRVVLVGYVANV